MRRPVAVAVLAIASLLSVVACSDDTTSSTRVEQRAIAATEALLRTEGFGCRLLRSSSPTGTAQPDRCMWVADTQALRDRGLMGVTDPGLAGREAMAFTFPGTTTDAFWMSDTLIPLTVVWVGADGRVIGTTDMEPCETVAAKCPTYAPPGPYAMAIEVAKGRAPALGLTKGASLELSDVPC